MIILGIDPGITAKNPCGVAIINWNDGQPLIVYHDAVYHKAHPLPYLVATLDSLTAFACSRLDGIAVEAPHLGLNAQVLARLAEVVGIVISYGARQGVPVLRCQPVQAKQALTGDPRADKPAMVAAVRQQFGATLVKDTADAVGVALWGAAQFSRYALEATQ